MKRLLAGLTALAIAGSLLFIAANAAAIPASISVRPSCGAVGATVQVTGSGWTVGFDVTIQFDPNGSPPAGVTVPGKTIGANGNFTADLTIPSRPNNGLAYQVVATQRPPSAAGVVVTANAPFYIPCPTLALRPNCGSVRQPIAIHGEGFRTDLRVAIYFTPPTGTQPDTVAVPKADSTFDVAMPVPSRPPGTYVVQAVQVFAAGIAAAPQLIATAAFQIPCTKGTIKLIPTVGPPGTVTTVIGTGFPVGALVKLRWSQGIQIASPSIAIDASQGFQLTLLIYPHDELGLRHLSAGPDLTNPNAPLFNIATADFLVVPGSAQPRDFSWRH